MLNGWCLTYLIVGEVQDLHTIRVRDVGRPGVGIVVQLGTRGELFKS